MRTALLVLCLIIAAPAFAGAEHDEVRRAMEAGEILPLRDILGRAEAAFPGQFIEAELEHEEGRPIYEIKLLAADGRLLKLEYDARNGELLSQKERRR